MPELDRKSTSVFAGKVVRKDLVRKVKVRYLSDDDKHWAELVNFGHKFVHVPEHFLREYDRILMGGIWAQIDIRHQYDEDAKGKRSPFWIDSLKPIQIATFDLAEFKNCRREFSADEWLDLLLRTIGLEPQNFDRRLKMMFLVRMIPLCEHNYNLVDLGPRGTGKSYAYQEFSPYTIPLTGPTTAAVICFPFVTSVLLDSLAPKHRADVSSHSGRVMFNPYPPYYRVALASSAALNPAPPSAYLTARFPGTAQERYGVSTFRVSTRVG